MTRTLGSAPAECSQAPSCVAAEPNLPSAPPFILTQLAWIAAPRRLLMSPVAAIAMRSNAASE